MRLKKRKRESILEKRTERMLDIKSDRATTLIYCFSKLFRLSEVTILNVVKNNLSDR